MTYIANFLTQRKIGERLTAWLETLLKRTKIEINQISN